MGILRYQGHGDFHSILVMSSLLPLPGSVCGRRHEITPGRKPASNHRAYGHERHIVTFPRRFPSACGTSRSRSYDPGQVIFDWFGRLRTGLTNTQQRHAALGRGQYQSIPVGVGQLYQCLSLGLRLCSLPRLEADSTSQGFPGWQLPHSDLVSGHVRAPRLCCDLSLVFAAGRHMMSCACWWIVQCPDVPGDDRQHLAKPFQLWRHAEHTEICQQSKKHQGQCLTTTDPARRSC